MAMDKDTEDKIQQLQLIEQNLQNFLLQRQQFQSQLTEIDSALEQIKGKQSAYRIISNIMVADSAKDIKKDLEEKKNVLELRIKHLNKQEEKIKERAKELQKEVLGKIKK